MERKYFCTVPILLAVMLFTVMGKLSFAGISEVGSDPVKVNENSGAGLNNSLEASSTKRVGQDEKKQIEKEKKLFFERTASLRKQIFEKKLSMRSELIKNPPNGRTLDKLRREILKLKFQLNRQRYVFLKKISTINPQVDGYYERGIMGNDPVKY